MPIVAKEDLSSFCQELTKGFKKKQLVLLQGDLGAGKTTLVKEVVRSLGVDEVDSPTFSIINEYSTSPPVFHVDLYRLETPKEIESTGFWDLFDQESAIVFVEWPERVDDKDWPVSWPKITIRLSTTRDENLRRFDISS